MSDLRISLNNIRNVKKVYIDGIGGFTVRKLGAGEELDLSDKMRRLGEILKELQAIDFTKYDVSKEDDKAELEAISKHADTLTQEVSQIQRFELETYKQCFEDDQDGKNVDKLLDSLSAQDRANLFNEIFNPVQAVEPPQPLEPTTVINEPAKVAKKAVKKAKKQ